MKYLMTGLFVLVSFILEADFPDGMAVFCDKLLARCSRESWRRRTGMAYAT